MLFDLVQWLVFFLNQKKAYEMRISDWSADVFSSDLTAPRRGPPRKRAERCSKEGKRCGSLRASLRANAYDAHHSGVHMVEKVAVERPIAERVGGEIEGRDPARLDQHRMLARRAIALARHQLEKMAVEMDGGAHHRKIGRAHV